MPHFTPQSRRRAPMAVYRGFSVTGQFKRRFGAVAAAALSFVPAMAWAQEAAPVESGSQPLPGEFALQHSVTPIMDSIVTFHNGILLWMCGLIVALVLGLIIVVVVRFNAKANPVPSKTTHNTLVEILWTVLPI